LLGTSDNELAEQEPAIEPSRAIGVDKPSASSHGADPTSPPAPALPSSSNNEITREPPSGEHFIAWLRQRVQSRKLIINDAKALVHTVADTAFLVSPAPGVRLVVA
jgi:hypothetical protein